MSLSGCSNGHYNTMMMGDGTSPRQIAIGAAVLVIFAASVYLLANARPSAPSPAGTPSPSVAEVPPLTPAMEAVLAASNGFQYLVSYTDRGFEPPALTIKKGETIRFTNNSGGGLWVASVARPGATVYPGQSDCGVSAFGTCAALKPGDFWEFTFDVSGTWSYKNISDTAKTGTVTVR